MLQDLEGSAAQRLLQAEAKAAQAFFAGAEVAAFEQQLQAEAAHLLVPEVEMPSEDQGGFEYYQRHTPEGFVVFCRRPHGGAEEVLVDTAVLAEEAGTGFADVGACKVSDDHAVLAYTVDVHGDEGYELRFRRLPSAGGGSSSSTSSVDDQAPWAARLQDVRNLEFTGHGDADTGVGLLLVRSDPHTRRAKGITLLESAPFQLLGPEASREGHVLWDEADEAAYLEVFRTKDRKHILMSSNTKDTSEVRAFACRDPAELMPAAAPPAGTAATIRQLLPRREGVEYFAEHHHGWWYVMSNHERVDFAVYRLRAAFTGAPASWDDLQPFFTPPGCFHVTDADLMERWLVLYGHEGAGPRICAVPLGAEAGGLDHASASSNLGAAGAYLAELPPVGSVEPGVNADSRADFVRFTFRAPLEPGATFDLHLPTKEVRPFSCRRWSPTAGITPDMFRCDRVEYPARDGVLVPITLLRPRWEPEFAGPRPCLLHVYGAYGSCLTPDFRTEHLALARRGWVVAWAHVRGGGELGHEWHAAGRGLNKARSVLDLSDAMRFLVARDITAPGLLCLKGASAGGLTLGALLNSPRDVQLLAAAILEVPFVDVLTGMLDPALPLTVHEFAEWGDPRQDVHAENLRLLSPYENLGSHPYPPLYLSCAMEDARVPPWMPLKLAARLRARSAGYLEASTTTVGARRRSPAAASARGADGSNGSGPCVVLHCADGGHAGAADWHGRSEEFARQIVFLQKAVNLPLR